MEQMGLEGLHKLAGFTDAEYRGLRAVKAAMPARWCSLAVEAGTCPVHIQSLVCILHSTACSGVKFLLYFSSAFLFA
jgi:hypothetical protein